MQTRVISVPHTATYEEAARLLHVYNISGLPVVNDEGIIIGIISEKDLFRILYPNYSEFYTNPGAYLDLEIRESEIKSVKWKPVTDFMVNDVITVKPDDLIMKAGSLMLSKGVNRLVVMEDGELKGILSRRDIFKNILQKHLLS